MRFLALTFTLPLLAATVAAQATPCHADFNTPVFDTLVSMGGPIVAIKTQSPNALAAGRIEMFTGEATGMNTVAIWSHNATLNQPLASLGSGSWGMSSVNGWQGANLATPVPILPGTDFWVVWTPVANAQASVQAQSGPGAQTYRASTDGGQSWNGPFVGHQWKFRIFCGSGLADYESFGKACSGSSRTLPTLGFSGAPAMGQPFALLLEKALPSSTVIFVTGISGSQWLGLTLPLDLTPYGLPGCTLLASGHILLPLPTTATGTASVQFTVPTDPSLAGAPIFNQWWAIDPTANPLTLVFSNGGRGKIGN